LIQINVGGGEGVPDRAQPRQLLDATEREEELRFRCAGTTMSPAKMPDTWYVTFELQKRGLLSGRRRRPRATRRFPTEADAKNFARAKLDEGLVVFAGTINPQFPKQLVNSSQIPEWLGDAPKEKAS
jgi:hypothetical protein